MSILAPKWRSNIEFFVDGIYLSECGMSLVKNYGIEVPKRKRQHIRPDGTVAHIFTSSVDTYIPQRPFFGKFSSLKEFSFFIFNFFQFFGKFTCQVDILFGGFRLSSCLALC